MKNYTDGILIVILIEILNDYLFYLALGGNNKPFRVTHSTSSGKYRYSVSGRPTLTTVLVFQSFFLFFCVSISLSLCQSLCVSVDLFTVTLKFLNVSLVPGLEFKKCRVLIKMLRNSSKNHGRGINGRVWQKTASSAT